MPTPPNQRSALHEGRKAFQQALRGRRKARKQLNKNMNQENLAALKATRGIVRGARDTFNTARAAAGHKPVPLGKAFRRRRNRKHRRRHSPPTGPTGGAPTT